MHGQCTMKMKLALFSLALLLVVALCFAVPTTRSDEEPPSPPARKPLGARGRHPLQPLRALHEEHRWRLSLNSQGRVQDDSGPSSGKLFRRQADIDDMLDKLLHIRRYHAPS